MEITTKSASETQKLGKKIATGLINSTEDKRQSTKGATTLALSGDLGSGKTTFLQGFAKGLGITQRIISPTFILLQKYDIKLKAQSSKFKVFYHIDLYRLEKNVEKEIINLGFKEIISNPNNIVAIEWADKAIGVYPKDTIWVKFENKGENKRRISIKK